MCVSMLVYQLISVPFYPGEHRSMLQQWLMKNYTSQVEVAMVDTCLITRYAIFLKVSYKVLHISGILHLLASVSGF